MRSVRVTCVLQPPATPPPPGIKTTEVYKAAGNAFGNYMYSVLEYTFPRHLVMNVLYEELCRLQSMAVRYLRNASLEQAAIQLDVQVGFGTY
jgi:hypothetical protein